MHAFDTLIFAIISPMPLLSPLILPPLSHTPDGRYDARAQSCFIFAAVYARW